MHIRTLTALALCVSLALTACTRETAAPEAAAAQDWKPALQGPVDHVDTLAREPMVVEHPGGALFVSGYGAGVPQLWRSDDGGSTWTRVNVGTEADGAVGNSDVDLAVAPDGTLYFAAMTYDRQKLEGVQIAVGATRDGGATWSWSLLSRTRYDDRPWVAVTPDGTAHVVWNDGTGVSYAVSRDAGRTWQEQPRIHPQGGSSHLAVGPGGELAVRITPASASYNIFHEGVDLIAVSTDGGTVWSKHQAPGEREWAFPITEDALLFRWVEPLAWDAAGHLYSLWTDPSGVWLARSADRGATWRTWRIVEGGEQQYFPYLVGGARGELAASWFSGRGEGIQVHVARIDVPGDDEPRVFEAEPFAPDSWRRGQKPGEPRQRDPAGEYVPLVFLRDGRLAVVTTIQDDQAGRAGFSWRTMPARPASNP